jgi:putative protease
MRLLKKPELLAPAGSFAKLQAAVHYGADAVYLGGRQFSLRAHATNFNNNEIGDAVTYAHERGVKVYVTVNILAHNRDLTELPAYLESLGKAEVDGLIISDPGVMRSARNIVPELPIHLSTQANVTNLESARFWQEQGVKRINTARELSLTEISEIKQGTDLEIESFVHGALCISYSGRCLLSCYLTGRSANQGDCAHPCRYNYNLVEEKRPGQFFPVEEDERGTYIFNSRDLCLLDRLPELLEAGVDCLKIEGRMKTIYYTGAVTRVYRAALDHLYANWPDEGLPKLDDHFMAELSKIGSRGYTENFLSDPPDRKDMLYDQPHLTPSHHPVGIVVETGTEPLIDIRNPLLPGDIIEHLDTGIASSFHKIDKLFNEAGDSLIKANPGTMARLTCEPPADHWETGALLRKKI